VAEEYKALEAATGFRKPPLTAVVADPVRNDKMSALHAHPYAVTVCDKYAAFHLQRW
jgi:hypothetical protein